MEENISESKQLDVSASDIFFVAHLFLFSSTFLYGVFFYFILCHTACLFPFCLVAFVIFPFPIIYLFSSTFYIFSDTFSAYKYPFISFNCWYDRFSSYNVLISLFLCHLISFISFCR